MPGLGDLFKTSDDITRPDLSWMRHPPDTVTIEINVKTVNACGKELVKGGRQLSLE